MNDDSRHYTDYNKLAADGRALYGRLVRGFERPKPPAPLVLPPVDPTDPNVPKPPYFTTWTGPESLCAKTRTLEGLKELNQPTDEYMFIEVHSRGPLDEPPEVAKRRQSPYQNYVHRDGRTILCMVNYADRDLRYKTEEQLWWSDLMAGCYSRVTKTWKTTADIQPLESIWRVFISNPQTLAVIDRIVGEGKDTIEIPAGDDRLFALLATSHGKGPGRMLVTYPHLFGRVFIRSVRI
ncbi:hypothetical protein NKR19_g1422 [Coniochaeta hoffmannii]|uniref:Uncharacterized protein n=1 Tax=Coniochaeta hoffmannii TaxID=91930 RepID=A0AA38W0W2_9PEZI|nr:hypothetical protein NKR19_g1422 [Coniochaeta hoffmannii]